MSEVAKLAGVSQTTVSLILNNHKLAGRIPPETRNRVLETVRATGYRPSQSARRLTGKGSGLIGFICGEIRIPGNARLNHHLHLELKNQGYRLLTMPTEWIFREEMEALDLLFDRSVDGVILYSRCLQEDSPIRRKVLDEGFPLITYQEQQPEFSSVQSDYSPACREALREAAALGHRRIIHIGQPQATELHRHFRDVCAEFGFELEEHYFTVSPDTAETPELDRCLEQLKLPALLVMESGDVINTILRFFLRRRRFPQEAISLLAINPSPQQQQFFPELSAIQADVPGMAHTVAELITSTVRGERDIRHKFVNALYLPGQTLALR